MILTPGEYETKQVLNIRREPRITGSNIVGQLSAGTRRTIYSLITNDRGETWGRVSESDNAGIAEWVCIQNLNRKFMEQLTNEKPPVVSEVTRAEFDRLVKWAREKGYTG